MRILVTGASGKFGQVILPQLRGRHDVTESHLVRENCVERLFDLTDPGSCADFIQPARFDSIIHLAGLTNPDVCEAEPDRAFGINCEGTRNLLKAVEENTTFVLVSTDYVFDGMQPPYIESDVAIPLNVYGDSKKSAEILVREMASRFLILRLPVLYGFVDGRPLGILEEAMKYLQRQERAEIDDRQIRYPTSFADAARAIEFLLCGGYQGIFHFSAPEPTTKYSFCLRIARMTGKAEAHIVRSGRRSRSDAPRPGNCALSTGKYKATNGPMPSSFSDLLADRVADLRTVLNADA